jgi:phospholipid-binding lipoprotein MlaA
VRTAQAIRVFLACALVAGSLSCASAGSKPSPQESGVSAVGPSEAEALDASFGEPAWDPLQPMNRVFFMVHNSFERAVLRPFSRFYGWLVPDGGKRAVRRMFANLSSTSTFVNDVIQLELDDAATTAVRFAVNSTLGMGGLFDPAAEAGFARHHSDFGQTLWMAGFGAGPYLVVPLIGPTTARDGIGDLADGFLHIQFWVLGPFEGLLFSTSDGLTLHEEALEGIEELERSSVDFYAALRDAYAMNRQGQLEAEAARRRRNEAWWTPPPGRRRLCIEGMPAWSECVARQGVTSPR